MYMSFLDEIRAAYKSDKIQGEPLSGLSAWSPS